MELGGARASLFVCLCAALLPEGWLRINPPLSAGRGWRQHAAHATMRFASSVLVRSLETDRAVFAACGVSRLVRSGGYALPFRLSQLQRLLAAPDLQHLRGGPCQCLGSATSTHCDQPPAPSSCQPRLPCRQAVLVRRLP
ncbi:conserved hypothetical protein [Xanthomonas citri pv. fuscans]|nr:conserved hypothetical protein [Xanthomonas citri pv. fuscans]SOO33510.1 conserved hypothetical protein [Xanthomonas citri pv. fuscans]